MPRFVILEHDHPFWHLDFMLEMPAALRTWRLRGTPQAGAPVDAELIGDHRLAYLDYEGAVSGGRGFVKRWDAGTYQSDTPVESDRVAAVLQGRVLFGRVVLEKRDEDRWVFLLTQGSAGSKD